MAAVDPSTVPTLSTEVFSVRRSRADECGDGVGSGSVDRDGSSGCDAVELKSVATVAAADAAG